MARMNLEFNCPQFYDFNTEVHDGATCEHRLGGDSPGIDSSFNLKLKNLMKKNWNDKLRNTPINKSIFVKTNRQINATDLEKLSERKKRLSKSEGSLNAIGACVKNLKKDVYYPVFYCERSLSESDIRPKKKFPVTPKKGPAIPMCLKKTLKKLKTTEELELEKIAELQRQTKQHLRLNEKNMRRMKMKPKPLTVPKMVPLKVEKKEKSAAMKEFQKGLEFLVKRHDYNKSRRYDVAKPTRKSLRLGAVSSYSDLDVNSSRVLQQPFSGLLREVLVAEDKKDILNELSFKKFPGHSGLFLHKNDSQKAALKPFNFQNRVFGPPILSKSSMNENKENENKVQHSHSFHTSHLRKQNKENVCIKMASKTDAGISKRSFKF